jgi:hypothetical protein
MVGTARINATILLTAVATRALAIFFAQSSAPKKAMIAPKIVDRMPRQNVTSN